VYLSIFDLDGTILKINSSFYFYIFLFKKKIFKRKTIFRLFIYYLRYKYFNLSIEKLHKKVFTRYVKGLDIKLFSENFDKFLDKYLNHAFYMPSINKINESFYNNHLILLLSSSPSFIVSPIAEILKIQNFKATEYKLNEENKIQKIFFIMNGAKKAAIALDVMKKNNIDKENVFVYSDSIHDMKLFDVAKNKIAVNPCKKLKKIAIKNGWEIV